MKSDKSLRMLVHAPGVNHWREVDRAVRRIFKLHADSDRLARREAGQGGNRQVRRSGKVACGVHQRHIDWHPKEENLQWAVDRAAADILDGHSPVEGFGNTAVRQPGGCRGNLTRRYGGRQLDTIDACYRYAAGSAGIDWERI